MSVRVRFAPSPTGSLHLGSALTAVANWLFARQQGGELVLRIDDTDEQREVEGAERAIEQDLRWLGLAWDEGPDMGGAFGPYRQSERLGIYRDMVERLLRQGDAYRCYCTELELNERKKAALARGEPPGYDGRCRTLTDGERAAFVAEGRTSVVRFHMPQREWIVHDLVKGEVRWSAGDLRDFVLERSDGSPVFLLAVAVDDLLMAVTHVVRGDDLLASAPRNAAGLLDTRARSNDSISSARGTISRSSPGDHPRSAR